MGKIIAQCPSCDGNKLHVTNIECAECATVFKGHFDIPPLLKLPEEDLLFILDFVKCSGSLKEMATRQNVSYPTLRNRLNALIDTLESLDIKRENSKTDILQLLEDGKISAVEAAKMLTKL
jgi:hypothetical protein